MTNNVACIHKQAQMFLGPRLARIVSKTYCMAGQLKERRPSSMSAVDKPSGQSAQ